MCCKTNSVWLVSSQVFLIISHSPLVRQLADIIFNGDVSVCLSDEDESETASSVGPHDFAWFVWLCSSRCHYEHKSSRTICKTDVDSWTLAAKDNFPAWLEHPAFQTFLPPRWIQFGWRVKWTGILVHACWWVLFTGPVFLQGQKSKRGFMKPSESLAKTLDSNRGVVKKPRKRPNYRNEGETSESTPRASSEATHSEEGRQEGNSTFYDEQQSATSTEDLGTAQNGLTQIIFKHCSLGNVKCWTTEGLCSGRKRLVLSENFFLLLLSHLWCSRLRILLQRSRNWNLMLKLKRQLPVRIRRMKRSCWSVPEDQQKTCRRNFRSVKGKFLPKFFKNGTKMLVIHADYEVYRRVSWNYALAKWCCECTSHIVPCDFRPYLEAVFNALECTENDYEALFALCLLYALGHNEGKENFFVQVTKQGVPVPSPIEAAQGFHTSLRSNQTEIIVSPHLYPKYSAFSHSNEVLQNFFVASN